MTTPDSGRSMTSDEIICPKCGGLLVVEYESPYLYVPGFDLSPEQEKELDERQKAHFKSFYVKITDRGEPEDEPCECELTDEQLRETILDFLEAEAEKRYD